MMKNYMVELVSRDFSCPVGFDTLEQAEAYAIRQQQEGAFRARIYRMDGKPSGTLVKEI